ncbi:MAG: peptide chain release factor 1 [Erysipelotrichaceae bacterium]|nr:peptide chain release factor 1 [Erysipelotrichaceae bacterium]
MADKMIERLEAMVQRVNDIDSMLCEESIVSDVKKLTSLNKERASLQDAVEEYLMYKKDLQDLADAEIMVNEPDEEIAQFAKESIKELTEKTQVTYEKLKIMLLPKDPNDDKDIVCEIRGAAGGDEANIFAGDLFRMYTRYAESQGWKIQIVDESPSSAGGFASVSFIVRGENVYSKLKFESGAHRVQRIPSTEASGRIHTSTATVLVMPEAEEVDVEINQSDLKIDTYRSSGAGGQNVNKTESAVRITHIPTGIVVACQVERSQIQNREIAMNLLKTRILAAKQAEQDEKIGNERRLKVGTGERSEKIRTYNYPQNRVTDHRISFTIQKLDRVMEGDLDDVIGALVNADQQDKMEQEARKYGD